MLRTFYQASGITIAAPSTSSPRAEPAPGTARPVVAVYREMLLNYNEPFIRAQAEGLTRYRSIYVGACRVTPGLITAPQRTIVVRDCFAPADRLLDPIVTHLPPRGIGRRLRGGSVVARATELCFKRFGITPPQVLRTLRRHHPVLMHAYTGVSGAQALPLARRLGIPLVATCTGYEATATDEEMSRWPSRGGVFLRRREALKREAALFVAVSNFVRDRLIARGWPAHKIVVHYVGVALDAFRLDASVQREPIVLFVGRLIETKGVSYLIEAMRLVQQRLGAPRARLVLIGDGPLRRELERGASDAGVHATFVGALPQDQVRTWMNRASLLCIPSVTAADGTVEALPAVVFEAMAMALTVTGFASGGISEAVEHEQTGLLAPERDVPQLASHIERLLSDRALWSRCSDVAQQRVRERFDLDRQTTALEALYDQARGHAASRAVTWRRIECQSF